MTRIALENWFVFKSYNRQSIYAFGTEDEADKYNDHLNEGPYYWAFYPLTAKMAEDLGIHDDSDLGICLSVALQDIEETS